MLGPRRHPVRSGEDRGHTVVRCKLRHEIDLRMQRICEYGLFQRDSRKRSVRPAAHRIERKHEGQTRTRYRQRGIIGTHPRLNLGCSLRTGTLQRRSTAPHPLLMLEPRFPQGLTFKSKPCLSARALLLVRLCEFNALSLRDVRYHGPG
eukprot:3616115-Pleurochrysis_carterae.AAC.1